MYDNPLKSPPAEVVKQGKDAIKRYFELLKKEGKGKKKPQYLFEVKMLVIGEGGTGKTTLIHKLKDKNAAMPKDKDTTIGIDVVKWDFALNKALFANKIPDLSQDEMHVSCWDFGGQKIYHGTHQIFYGENALYILVEDTREQKTDFSYWFNTIEQLAGENAMVFVVLNQKYGHRMQFDHQGFGSRFSFIVNDRVMQLDLENDTNSIVELQNRIQTRLQEMPEIGKPLPSAYIEIRNALYAIDKSFISLDEFLEVCQTHGLEEYEDIKILSKFYHEIGAITHFIDDDVLQNLVFLDSNWLVKTLYKVLDAAPIKEKQGRICLGDAKQIWENDKLHFRVKQLTKLMHNFGLMYQVKDKQEFVIPAHLPTSKPYTDWQHAANNGANTLQFKYEFDKYMPEGLMSHFIVSLHDYIEKDKQNDGEIVWHRGMNIVYENTFAEIIESYGGTNTFVVKITGAQKQELLAIIRQKFEEILKPFKKLQFTELVPCNCNQCKNNCDPHFYKFADLLRRKEKGKQSIECEKSYEDVRVHDLLANIAPPIDKTSIENLISKNKTQEALERMEKWARNIKNRDLLEQVILLLSRYSSNENANNAGTLEKSFYDRESVKINHSLLEILKEFS